MESILVAFRGLSATSDRISVILDLLNELDAEERLQWQEAANSFFHRDFVGFLPPELAYKILDMLDAPTLLRCCQVSKRWLQRLDANHLIWIKLAQSQGARVPQCKRSLEDANFMRRLVARSLGQRHSIRSGKAFKVRKILEENPNFTVTDCCDNLLAAANVYDINSGKGAVVLYDLDIGWDREIVRLPQSPEFGFPCAIKLFSANFVCVGYVSGKLACYSLSSHRELPRGPYRGIHTQGRIYNPTHPLLMQPTPQGSIYCVGGCTKTNVFVCGGSDSNAYIWDLDATSGPGFLGRIQNPPDEAVLSANISGSAIVTMSKRFIRIYKYAEKSHISTAARSPPWSKISLGALEGVEPALAEAFFTPGVHYRDGTVTFVRQKPLFETATIGNADIVTIDCSSGVEINTTHVNQKIRKLLAVGSRFALALLPFFGAVSHKNLIVIDLLEKKVVGGRTVPHSKSTTPDLSQIALGNTSWLDGLGNAEDSSLLIGLPVINQSHVLLVNVF